MSQTIKTITDPREIQKLLPQREPMIMVDRLDYFDSKKIKTALTIRHENVFVEKGHLSEAGIIEHIAQSIALLTGHVKKGVNEPTVGYIGGIKDFEIYELPHMGKTLETQVEVTQEFMGMRLSHAEVYLGTKLIASGVLKTATKP
ncbi:MAG: hypothetical protein CL868_08825 [Cytophagaceae bacterium]|nr:hypothetical protein [Cytophagaceae bacterium]|tara:strand:+ start:1154 stop:1588 length:435 start_codon:yes stop_codon:yes gene_type:complete